MDRLGKKLLRLPGIRHVRWWWYRWKVNDHYSMWLSMGYVPTRDHVDSDEQWLDAIWRGDA